MPLFFCPGDWSRTCTDREGIIPTKRIEPSMKYHPGFGAVLAVLDGAL